MGLLLLCTCICIPCNFNSFMNFIIAFPLPYPQIHFFHGIDANLVSLKKYFTFLSGWLSIKHFQVHVMPGIAWEVIYQTSDNNNKIAMRKKFSTNIPKRLENIENEKMAVLLWNLFVGLFIYQLLFWHCISFIHSIIFVLFQILLNFLYTFYCCSWGKTSFISWIKLNQPKFFRLRIGKTC